MQSKFLKTPQQVAGGTLVGEQPLFRPAEVLSILYETKPEAIAAILPPPLTPYEQPYVIVAYNYFKEVGFDSGLRGPGYRETALYIPAVYDGMVGTFVAAMTLDTDMGTFLGREKYGYPKKIGTVDHYYKENTYVAYSARHGIPYCTMVADLDGVPNDPSFMAELSKITAAYPDKPGWAVNWTFKSTVGIDKDMYLHQPMLVKGWKSKCDLNPPVPTRIGKGTVQLVRSEDDPWAELEVVKVLGAVLVECECRMYSAESEYIPIDAEAYKPYAFFGWDPMTME